MPKLLTIGLVIGVLVILILYVISTYNKLIYQREYIYNAMGNISAAIESRWDALTNLISATNKYSEHEASVLKDVTAQRTGVSKNSTPAEIVRDEELFNKALSRINVVAENYPQLKADQVYIKTMDSVNSYEDVVRKSRMIYNDTVTKFNRMVQVFPASLVASIFGFRKEDYFKNTESKAEMPSW